MCLILFAYQVHPQYPLIVAANRDEFYERPTAKANFWEDYPFILAGRDLEKMGTWMGVTKSGRFAALTNFRDPKEILFEKRSRGEIVKHALTYPGPIAEYMETLQENSTLYPGYNLIAGSTHELFYYSNRGKKVEVIAPGVHGVSNHLLNTPWPKVVDGKKELAKLIKYRTPQLVEQLFNLLQKSDPFPNEMLPKTGVSLEWERKLSPLFIKSEGYGTRSSTVILFSNEKIEFFERSFSEERSEQIYTIPLQ